MMHGKGATKNNPKAFLKPKGVKYSHENLATKIPNNISKIPNNEITSIISSTPKLQEGVQLTRPPTFGPTLMLLKHSLKVRQNAQIYTSLGPMKGRVQNKTLNIPNLADRKSSYTNKIENKQHEIDKTVKRFAIDISKFTLKKSNKREAAKEHIDKGKNLNTPRFDNNSNSKTFDSPINLRDMKDSIKKKAAYFNMSGGGSISKSQSIKNFGIIPHHQIENISMTNYLKDKVIMKNLEEYLNYKEFYYFMMSSKQIYDKQTLKNLQAKIVSSGIFN